MQGLGKKLAVVFVFGMFVVGLNAKTVERTVAVVNGEVVLQSEFERNVGPVIEQFKKMSPAAEQTEEKLKDLKKEILEQMIDEKVILGEAKKKSIKITKREIDDGREEIRKRFPTEKEFKEELAKQHLKVEAFDNRIKEQLMMMKLIDQEVKAKAVRPGEEEVKNLFNKLDKKIAGKKVDVPADEEKEFNDLAKFFEREISPKVKVRHILIRLEKGASLKESSEALNRLKDIQQRIKKGEDFADLAKKYSEDPGSKEDGGSLGFFSKGEMVPEFEKSAFTLKEGEASEIVKTDFGYHLIKCIEKKSAIKFTFDDSRKALEEYVFRKKMEERYKIWIKDLRLKSTIKVNEIN
ncbi:MAG: peptidylprolyl isomerase [Elusimicrobiota bacterium]